MKFIFKQNPFQVLLSMESTPLWSDTIFSITESPIPIHRSFEALRDLST